MDLLHCTDIPKRELNGMRWNNLGVAYDRLGLRGKAIAAYERAIEKNETLAMSNLAQQYLSAGFFSQAKELCRKAIALPDCNDHVARTLASVVEAPEKEGKEEEVAFRGKAEAYLFPATRQSLPPCHPVRLSRGLERPELQSHSKDQENEFTAIGSYEELGGLELGVLYGGILRPKPSTYRVEYRAKILGRAVVGSVTRVKQGGKEEPNLLSSLGIDQKISVLMILDEKAVRVMENPHGRVPSVYTMKRPE